VTATSTATETPTFTIVQAVVATWTAEPTRWAPPTDPPVPRPRRALRTHNAGDILSPGALPSTLAGVHFAGPTATAPELFGGSPDMTAWTTEIAYATDERYVKQKAEELIDLRRRGFHSILRVDYRPHQHIPPVDDPKALERYTWAFLRLYKHAGGAVRFFVVGNEGNVDEPSGDPSRTSECEAGRYTCDPLAHAIVYRQVRAAVREQTDAYVLLGAVSPGTVDHPARWMGSAEYLGAVLNYLHPSEVDGLAIHAYAPGAGTGPAQSGIPLGHFVETLGQQIGAAHEAGFVSTPLFVTEMNQQGRPDPGFIRAAYQWIDDHNRSSRQDILAACWFVYHDLTGEWGSLALENYPDSLGVFQEMGAYPPGR
jgi:hypothetical protein